MPIYAAMPPPVGISYYEVNPDPLYVAAVIGIGTLQMQPYVMPAIGSFSAADIYVSNSYSATNAASSMAHTVSASIGVYTRTGSSLSLASSGSQTYAFTVTGSSSSVSYQGLKNLTIPLTMNATPGNYWVVVNSSTASVGNAIAGVFSNVGDSLAGGLSTYQGVFGISTAGSEQAILGLGSYSVSTAVFPGSIGFSELVGSALGNAARPIVNFRNFTA